TRCRTRARADCHGIAGEGIEGGDADDSSGRPAVGVEQNGGRRSAPHPKEGQRQARNRNVFSHYTLRFLVTSNAHFPSTSQRFHHTFSRRLDVLQGRDHKLNDNVASYLRYRQTSLVSTL